MTVIIAVSSILTFLVGFSLGIKNQKNPQKKSYKKILKTEETDTEYHNFLSYDGTEQ